MQGWVKLHRETQLNAVWTSTTPEQKVIFLTLLMMVNHAANQWEWEGDKYSVIPGQTITSIDSIVKAGGKGITPQKVRTALKKFEKYGILTDKSTKRGRLITLINWGKYQRQDDFITNELTVDQQTGNKQLTTNKNERNERMKEFTGNFQDENPLISYKELNNKNLLGIDTDHSLSYYMDKYQAVTGKEHSKLRMSTWQEVANSLLWADGIDLDVDNFKAMVDHYFSKDYNNGDCNRCITHFNHPDIKKVNFYEAVI